MIFRLVKLNSEDVSHLSFSFVDVVVGNVNFIFYMSFCEQFVYFVAIYKCSLLGNIFLFHASYLNKIFFVYF